MTLAYYYYLLIGLCHKKNRYKFRGRVLPPSPLPYARIQKLFYKSGPYYFLYFIFIYFYVYKYFIILSTYTCNNFVNTFYIFYTTLLRFCIDNIYVNKKKYITHNEVKSNTYTSKIITKQCIYFYNINTKQCG